MEKYRREFNLYKHLNGLEYSKEVDSAAFYAFVAGKTSTYGKGRGQRVSPFTGVHGKILSACSGKPYKTQTEIANKIGHPQSVISRSLKTLIKMGLLVRTEDGYVVP